MPETPLPDEARAVRDLLLAQCGGWLYDYALTVLSPAAAERALAEALTSAVTHSGRLTSREHERAWLYALARWHRDRLVDLDPGVGSWARRGPQPPLLEMALEGLFPAAREALDLSVRHELTTQEIALVVGQDAAFVERSLGDAAEQLALWQSALAASQGEAGCADLAGQVADWRRAPVDGRRLRAGLEQHVPGCPTCPGLDHGSAAALGRSLMARLPWTAAPATVSEQFGRVAPLPDRVLNGDGFPVQAATGSAGEFRSWEREVDELWEPRPDEADPEATIGKLLLVPLRLLKRPVKAVLTGGAVALIIGAAGAAFSASTSSSTRAGLTGVVADRVAQVPQSAPLPTEAPVTLDDPPRNPVTAAPTLPPASVQTTLPPVSPLVSPPASPPVSPLGSSQATPPPRRKKNPSAPPATPVARRTTQPTMPVRQGPDDPPAPGNRRAPTTAPSAKAVAKQLPKPPAPQVSLSQPTLDMDANRRGDYALSCPGATCTVTSASGSGGLSVSGTTVTVSDKAPAPGCSYVPKEGTVSVSWSATANGDGVTTQGSTTSSGTLTLPVKWKAASTLGGYGVYNGSSVHNSSGDC